MVKRTTGAGNYAFGLDVRDYVDTSSVPNPNTLALVPFPETVILSFDAVKRGIPEFRLRADEQR